MSECLLLAFCCFRRDRTGMRSGPEREARALRKLVLRNAIGISVAAVVAAWGSSAYAQSLPDALASAYLFNPTLKAARAQLRATDENVPRAKSGFRPTITGQATAGYQNVDTNVAGLGGDSYPRDYSVTVTQPIFRGFRTLNAVKGAQAQVEAG